MGGQAGTKRKSTDLGNAASASSGKLGRASKAAALHSTYCYPLDIAIDTSTQINSNTHQLQLANIAHCAYTHDAIVHGVVSACACDGCVMGNGMTCLSYIVIACISLPPQAAAPSRGPVQCDLCQCVPGKAVISMHTSGRIVI